MATFNAEGGSGQLSKVHGVVWEEMAFGDGVNNTQRGNGAMSRTPVASVTTPVSYPTELSPHPIHVCAA